MLSIPLPVITAGDVLISRSTARDLYRISVVPEASSMSRPRYEDGVDAGRRLAGRLAVNAWFTGDHTHFLHLGSPVMRPEAYMTDRNTPIKSISPTAEHGREVAEGLRQSADRGRTAAEEHRESAESARQQAEQFRVLAEDTRALAERLRSECDAMRDERESLRDAAEGARGAAEEARHATIATVAATADALSANLAQMQFLQDARSTLKRLRAARPDDLE
jgi:hypothetical protein